MYKNRRDFARLSPKQFLGPTPNERWLKSEMMIMRRIIIFYFILSSEIIENISAIKVVSIYSEMIWYHFTVD